MAVKQKEFYLIINIGKIKSIISDKIKPVECKKFNGFLLTITNQFCRFVIC